MRKNNIFGIQKKMRALQVVAPRNIKIIDISVPRFASNEVLVRVKYCATCPNWDITLYDGVDIFNRGEGYPQYPRPLGQPGHEMAGEVVAIGNRIKKFKVGDRVATTKASNNTRELGFYAEYVAQSEDLFVRIPDNISYLEASTMELAVYVASYVRWFDNLEGKIVGVSGLGPAGLLAAQMIRAKGASEIIILEPIPERRNIGRDLGFFRVVDPTDTAEINVLKETPLEAAIDCSGSAVALQNLMEMTRGQIVLFGILKGSVTYDVHHWLRWVNLIHPTHTRGGATVNDHEFILNLMKKGELKTRILISTELPLEDYAKGVEMLKTKKFMKIAFYPRS